MMIQPDAIALVALLPTDQGGRHSATPSEWFGCVLSVAGRNHDVRLQLDHSLEPGTTRRVGLVFLDETVASQLSVGLPFSLWEGGEIGFGRVERLVRADPIAAE